jgi:hypothetical protein
MKLKMKKSLFLCLAIVQSTFFSSSAQASWAIWGTDTVQPNTNTKQFWILKCEHGYSLIFPSEYVVHGADGGSFGASSIEATCRKENPDGNYVYSAPYF